jgi:hypothetical protein
MPTQLSLPGLSRRTVSRSSSAAAPAKKPDLVLMQAMDAHSTAELEAALEVIKSLPESAGQDTARRLIVGIIAYRTARDSKQAKLF